jgi:ribonucleoside-diphosphate reductase alpha chain/ribonucleoside-triphosphate reductase
MKLPEITFQFKDLVKYKGINPFKNALSEFVYLRTYSRWLEEKKRRETWLETCLRCVKYSLSLYRGPAKLEKLQAEADEMLDDMFNLRRLPSGRTMWVGGTEIIKSIPSANYNCAFTTMDNIEAFHDLFYLLMVGCGVGFSVEQRYVDQLPLFRNDISLKVKPYEWCGCPVSPEKTVTTFVETGDFSEAQMEVGDSREGWAQGLRDYLTLFADSGVNSIYVDADYVRPAGTRLKKFGGKASGPEPYMQMLLKIWDIISNAPEVEPGWSRLRPIDVMDICNIIGQNVVAGGVRRTAEIGLMDSTDEESIHAKDNFWSSPKTMHRSMSNNSIMFWEKPTREYLNGLVESIKNSYEPGFINAEAADKRRPNFAGVNPCVEILLPKNGFCNLSTVFMPATVQNGVLDIEMLSALIRGATRHAMRITNVDIELPEWDRINKRDRLVGVNITGCEDAFDACANGVDFGGDYGKVIETTDGSYTVEELFSLLNFVANSEAKDYAFEMRIPAPLLVCTIQPSGTLSQLRACSSGYHKSFAPYFIRRVRISAHDALAKVVQAQGYKIYPEVGNGYTSKEFNALNVEQQNIVLGSVNTWVVEFVVQTPSSKSASDESAVGQLHRYFAYQNNWTDHNTSATIQVADDEWDDLFDLLYKRWDEYIGVSFQNKSNDKYDLQPYEAITKEEYDRRFVLCPAIDIELLNVIENGTNSADDDLGDSCATGSCPVR